MNTLAPVVTLHNGVPTTTSLDIAEFFHKQHFHVLRDIENLRSQLDADRQSNFGLSLRHIPNPKGNGEIPSPVYIITRDGFTLLAMGFTGKRALAFKLAYIDAFNHMEATLKQAQYQAVRQHTPVEINVLNKLFPGLLDPVTLDNFGVGTPRFKDACQEQRRAMKESFKARREENFPGTTSHRLKRVV